MMSRALRVGLFGHVAFAFPSTIRQFQSARSVVSHPTLRHDAASQINPTLPNQGRPTETKP
jgi:hypothetical protein